jgi:hypothetical protein
MVQVIPNMPHPESTGSERLVLKLLRGVDWGHGARALNSLNLPEHLYQRWGEIDFLVIGPRGLLAIEVKGGDVSCTNGCWTYEDRLGRVVRRSKSPVVQAKDAYFSLIRNYVEDTMGKGFDTSVPAGFCVVLAGAGRKELDGLLGTPELPEELTGTREDVASPAAFEGFLKRVARHWQDKSRARREIAPRDVERLVKTLRPEFDKVRPLALSREQAINELVELTEEQYEALDLWEGASRILCMAPAGCGKTLLATELFRRARAEGSDALMLCGTDNLARAIGETLKDATRVVSLPQLEAMHPEHRPSADLLVIDEGQQALDPERMAMVDKCVRGGLRNGRWAWFGDPNYQLTIDPEVARVALDELRGFSSVQPKLRKNCRNTPEIVQFAELASGVQIGHALTKGRGFPPKTEEVGGDAGAFARVVGIQVRDWISQGIPASEICIIAPGSDAAEISRRAGLVGGFSVARWWEVPAPPNIVRYCDVDEFRGLESPFLVLCVPSFEGGDLALSKLFYLASTRANFALTVVAPPQVMERLKAKVEASLLASLG